MLKIRKYYSGGLISLIFIPILCVFFIQKSKVLKKQYAFDIERYNDEWLRNHPDVKFKQERNFQTITLNKNDSITIHQLEEARVLIKKMILQKDSINGIKIRFTNKTKYWSFVKALDICKVENPTAYAYYNDDLYIIEKPSVRKSIQNKKKWPCLLCGDLINTPDVKEKSLLQILKTNNNYWIILIGYIVLAGISLKEIFRNL